MQLTPVSVMVSTQIATHVRDINLDCNLKVMTQVNVRMGSLLAQLCCVPIVQLHAFRTLFCFHGR